MPSNIREIRCVDLDALAGEFPIEIRVIRAMLEDVDEVCLDQAA